MFKDAVFGQEQGCGRGLVADLGIAALRALAKALEGAQPAAWLAADGVKNTLSHE